MLCLCLFVFMINNYIDEDILSCALIVEVVKYFVYGKEKGESGMLYL